MVTIKDIAQIVNVSCTTVSNVINGKTGRVSEETIARINEVIEELGYVPNMSARSLVSNSSKVIGFINHSVIRKDAPFMEDPFHSAFINAIEATLREHGYYLMVRTTETAQDLKTFLLNWNVDGLFFIGIFEDDFLSVLKTFPIPVVLIDSYGTSPDLCNIGLEDFKGSYLAARHLIENGHRKIAFASPTIHSKGVVFERFSGYKKALAESDIPFNRDYVYQTEMDIESSIAVGKEIAAQDAVTGIVCTADILAAGIMAGIKTQGKRIPEDISIVGFDDLAISRLTSPALSTIHQDAHLKGTLAVDYMLEQLEDKRPPRPNIILPVYLIERDSVRKIG